MEITKERLNQLKSRIQIKKPLGKLLQDSLVVGGPMKGMRLKAAVGVPTDYQEFGFDIKLLKISGRIYKNGTLDFTGSVFGVQIAHTTVDISNNEICWNPSLGKLVGVRYCFYLKNKCLYTKGNIRGWVTPSKSWNQKILCF
jgi:hypothetical protein